MEKREASLKAWHYIALSLPAVGLLYPPFYARIEPRLWGIPFFYVYQFAWIPLSASLTGLVYYSIRRSM